MVHSIRFPLLMLLLASAGWPALAAAQVHRCALPGGGDVYTDRPCAELGGAERQSRNNATGAGNTSGARVYRNTGCARTVEDLVYDVTAAIGARDANRLASVYHWAGMSSSNANTIMARLDVVAQRPLVDVSPVIPAPRVSEFSEGASENEAPVDPELYPQTAVQRAPVAIRVDQTLSNNSTPSRTVFGLTRHFDCWWLRF